MSRRKKIVMGTCKMCLEEDVRLQESHYLSQGIYKAVRLNPALAANSNPNPFMLTPHEAKQTSAQVWAHLLCSECETRLGRNGEDWVMRNGLKSDGSFKLLKALHRHPFQLDASRTAAIYRAADIPEASVPALAYFAASIFWRGSIYPWNTDKTIPIPLGPYQEPLRRYLMGEAAFPEDVTLSVVIRMPSAISGFTATPLAEWRASSLVAKFFMPGFAFSICAGPDIPDPCRILCFVRGDRNPLVFTGELEKHILEEGMKMYQRIPPEKRPALPPNPALALPSLTLTQSETPSRRTRHPYRHFLRKS